MVLTLAPAGAAHAQVLPPPAASDTPAYDEQVRQCNDAMTHNDFPIGTAGYASVHDSCRTLEAEALQRDTGALVASGRCAEAVSLALRAGDMQLAVNIRNYCGADHR